MDEINQLKQLIEVQSEMITKQAAAIARHEDAIIHLEAQGLSEPGQHVAKKARNDDGADNALLTEAKAACAILFAKCHFVNDVPSVTLAKLKPEFEAVLRQPEKMLFLNWDRLYKMAKSALEKKNNKVLATYASSDLMITNALLRKTITGQFCSDPFGSIRDIGLLKNYVSLTHFAPPRDSHFLAAARAQALNEQNDQTFGQSDTHLTKKETNLIGQGPFDDALSTILGCVANFLLVADIVVGIHTSWASHSENPFIVNLLIKMATLFTNNTAKAKVKVESERIPHLLFNIFCGFQDVLGCLGAILMETPAVINVQNNENIDDSAFTTPYRIYTDRLKLFSDFVEFSATGELYNPKPSFYLFHPPAARAPIEDSKPEARKEKTKPANSAKGKGPTPEIEQGNWITAEAGIDISQNWKFDGFLFCRNHAFTNLTCKIPSCKHPHLTWAKLSADKKASVIAYIESTDTKFRLAK